MSEHPNAPVVRSMLAALEHRATCSALADMLADDVVWHEIGNPEPVRGKAALAARDSAAARSDFRSPGRRTTWWRTTSTPSRSLTATATRGGRSFSYRVAEIYHFRDGKITERWAFSDDTAAIAAFFA